MHAVIVIVEPPSPFIFLVEDVVEIMNYGVGEKEKLIIHRNVINVEERTVYEVLIYKGCVSVEVHKSEDDEYGLFSSVELDDPPIRKIEEDVGNFIL